MTADPSIHTIDTGFQRPDFDAAMSSVSICVSMP